MIFYELNSNIFIEITFAWLSDLEISHYPCFNDKRYDFPGFWNK